jgi:TonB family protein
MSAYPDLRPEPVSVDQFVRKIVLLCDRHDVAWGTPENLAEFMRVLKDDKHLAMDFWSVVALMSEEGSVVGPEPNRLLEVIVEGVTGRRVAEVVATGAVQRQSVSDLASLLAGEDIWSPVRKSAKKDDGTQGKAASAKPSGRTKEFPKKPAKASAHTADISGGAEGSVGKNKDRQPMVSAAPPQSVPERPASLASPPSRVTDPIVPATGGWRQERSSAGDAHRRILLEPFHDEQEAVRSEGEPFHGARGFSPVQRPGFLPMENKAADVDADFLPRRAPVAGGYDPLIRVPLAEYSETREPRKGLIAGVLLVIVGVAIGVGLIVRGNGMADLQGFEATIHNVHDKIVQTWHDRVMGGDHVQSVRSSAAGAERLDGSGGTAEGLTRGSKQIDESAGGTPAMVASDGVPALAAGKSGLNRVVTSAAEQQVADEREREAMNAEVGGLVHVPADAMTSHLISSRVPVYPEEAKAHHAEGPVVMQAVVTKSGAVGHLRVLSGDFALRAAAVAAVATWRYSPYTVNGQPVDVATTISVEFPAEW